MHGHIHVNLFPNSSISTVRILHLILKVINRQSGQHLDYFRGRIDRKSLCTRLMWKVSTWQKKRVAVLWSNCICHKDVTRERWGAQTSADDYKASLYPSCGTLTSYDCCWFILSSHGVTFSCVISSVATEQGVVHVEKSVLPIACPAVLNFSFDHPRGGWWEQSAETEASTHAGAGISVRQWNDLLCKPLFISDNMPSGYFSINGPSHWKAFIDVDSHTFWIARSSHRPLTALINGRGMGIKWAHVCVFVSFLFWSVLHLCRP